MIHISPIQERILNHLAHYKYLVVSQFQLLGVGHPENIRKALRTLRSFRLTDKASYGALMRTNHAQDIHYLTKRGAKLLAENSELTLDVIRYPKSTSSMFKNDYFHRISTINTQIAYDQWVSTQDYDSLFFDTYYYKLGNNRRKTAEGTLKSATRLEFSNGKHLTPDAIFMYDNGNKQLIYCLEVCNGKDTKRVTKQLKVVLQAATVSLAGEKYGYQKTNRVLATFEFKSHMNAVIERMQQDTYFQQEGIERFIFFQEAKKVWENFNEWLNLRKEVVQISDF